MAAAAAAAAVRRDVLAAGGILWFPAERRKPGVRARAAGGHKDAARGAAERVRAASRVGGAAAAIQVCARGADWPRASELRGKALVSCSSKETPVRRYVATVYCSSYKVSSEKGAWWGPSRCGAADSLLERPTISWGELRLS